MKALVWIALLTMALGGGCGDDGGSDDNGLNGGGSGDICAQYNIKCSLTKHGSSLEQCRELCVYDGWQDQDCAYTACALEVNNCGSENSEDKVEIHQCLEDNYPEWL